MYDDHARNLDVRKIRDWGDWGNWRNGEGVVATIPVLPGESFAAIRQLSGTLGYSVAKSGIDSFTKWMAVELARKHGDRLRVNAIAPGFFVTTQNESIMVKPDGSWTDRAERVIAQTPMGRFGRPEEVAPTAVLLASDPGGNLYVGQTLGPNSGDVMP